MSPNVEGYKVEAVPNLSRYDRRTSRFLLRIAKGRPSEEAAGFSRLGQFGVSLKELSKNAWGEWFPLKG